VGVGLVEVFLNGGAICFTKRLDTHRPVSAPAPEIDPIDIGRGTLRRLDVPGLAASPAEG
jgi:hypothetical protein